MKLIRQNDPANDPKTIKHCTYHVLLELRSAVIKAAEDVTEIELRNQLAHAVNIQSINQTPIQDYVHGTGQPWTRN